MPRTFLASLTLVLLFAAPPAQATLYQFTLRGTVTNAGILPQVAVGDPFVIQYTADSADLNPSTNAGSFAVSGRAVATLPRATIQSALLCTLSTELGGPFSQDSIDFFSDGGWLNGFACTIRYPSGTLVSDSLPLGLPLDNATRASWSYGGQFAPFVIGSITSYQSIEVPEPFLMYVLPFVVTLAATRPSRRPHRSIPTA
jgi:hypothetical protein